MDPPHAHHILPTNATSAANPLATTTPTAIARDTVIQTNRPGEPPEYREIKTTEKVLHPTPLEYAPPPDTSTETKTTTVEEAPKVPVSGTKTTTTVVENVPASTDYVVSSAATFRPVEVVTTTAPAESSTKKVVETTVTEPVTKKVTKTTKTVETTK